MLDNSIHEWAKENPQLRNYTEHTTSVAGIPAMGGSSWGQEDWDDYDSDDEEMHHHRHARRQPVLKMPKNGQDLLTQYDQGIERIGKWPRQATSV
jgi:hypothetical protein